MSGIILAYDEVVLKSNLSLKWAGSSKKSLHGGLCAPTPGTRLAGDELLYLELPSGVRRVWATRRVPQDFDYGPRYLLAGITKKPSVECI